MITRYDPDSPNIGAMNECEDGDYVRYSDFRQLSEAVESAMESLRASDNPPQMKKDQFLERCRIAAINILKRGLEIE